MRSEVYEGRRKGREGPGRGSIYVAHELMVG